MPPGGGGLRSRPRRRRRRRGSCSHGGLELCWRRLFGSRLYHLGLGGLLLLLLLLLCFYLSCLLLLFLLLRYAAPVSRIGPAVDHQPEADPGPLVPPPLAGGQRRRGRLCFPSSARARPRGRRRFRWRGSSSRRRRTLLLPHLHAHDGHLVLGLGGLLPLLLSLHQKRKGTVSMLLVSRRCNSHLGHFAVRAFVFS